MSAKKFRKTLYINQQRTMSNYFNNKIGIFLLHCKTGNYIRNFVTRLTIMENKKQMMPSIIQRLFDVLTIVFFFIISLLMLKTG